MTPITSGKFFQTMSLSILLSVRACLVTGFHDRAVFLEHLNLVASCRPKSTDSDLWGFPYKKWAPHVLLDSLISNWLCPNTLVIPGVFKGTKKPFTCEMKSSQLTKRKDGRRHVSRHTEYIQPTVFLPQRFPELSLLLFFLPNDTFLQFIAWATETLQTCAGKERDCISPLSPICHGEDIGHKVGTGGLSFLS